MKSEILIDALVSLVLNNEWVNEGTKYLSGKEVNMEHEEIDLLLVLSDKVFLSGD
jgi:hypothetical protein